MQCWIFQEKRTNDFVEVKGKYHFIVDKILSGVAPLNNVDWPEGQNALKRKLLGRVCEWSTRSLHRSDREKQRAQRLKLMNSIWAFLGDPKVMAWFYTAGWSETNQGERGKMLRSMDLWWSVGWRHPVPRPLPKSRVKTPYHCGPLLEKLWKTGCKRQQHRWYEMTQPRGTAINNLPEGCSKNWNGH